MDTDRPGRIGCQWDVWPKRDEDTHIVWGSAAHFDDCVRFETTRLLRDICLSTSEQLIRRCAHMYTGMFFFLVGA